MYYLLELHPNVYTIYTHTILCHVIWSVLDHLPIRDVDLSTIITPFYILLVCFHPPAFHVFARSYFPPSQSLFDVQKPLPVSWWNGTSSINRIIKDPTQRCTENQHDDVHLQNVQVMSRGGQGYWVIVLVLFCCLMLRNATRTLSVQPKEETLIPL
jgi:hypothetical protein